MNSRPLLAAGCIALALPVHGLAAEPSTSVGARAGTDAENDDLRQRLAEQARQLDTLKRALAAQEAELAALRQRFDARSASTATASVSAASAASPAPPAPVASANPPPDTRTASRPPDAAPPATVPQVATIFEQPGVLTPAGKLAFEPSLQYSYSSSNRVALVGYTVIPAILVGLVDVREVKRTTFTGAVALRYGLTNRLEVEAKLPYVYRYDTSIGSEVVTGSTTSTSVFDAAGKGIGDVEFTARYQLNEGGADKPYYVGSLRVKTRTGKDPFQIPVSTSVAGFRGDGLQTELPTGSGFYGVQPALTMLVPSDPAVFFGTVSYLYSQRRQGVTRLTDQGTETLGTIAPGGIFGFNFGMGIALNERSSFSIGYDHSSVGKTRQNGVVADDSVQLQLGTLLLGYSYRLDEHRSINLSLGAGLTRDTPDVTLTLRVPTSF